MLTEKMYYCRTQREETHSKVLITARSTGTHVRETSGRLNYLWTIHQRNILLLDSA